MKQQKKEFIKIIERQVLDKVGNRHKIWRVQVFNVYDDKYRVNLQKGDGYVLASYFIQVSDKGEIIESNPKIESI